MYFKKIWNLSQHLVTHYFTFFLNSDYEYAGFQFSQTDGKGYTYQFSHFIPTKKSRINVCVMCPYYALKESSDLLQSVKCKCSIVLLLLQTLIPNT